MPTATAVHGRAARSLEEEFLELVCGDEQLLRAEFDNMRDGIVYGALVGLGFNWFEAALYVAQGYAENGVAPYGMAPSLEADTRS